MDRVSVEFTVVGGGGDWHAILFEYLSNGVRLPFLNEHRGVAEGLYDVHILRFFFDR